MQLLDLYAGRAFRMGKGSNWRIVHPEMGARRLTLNHGLHEPDQEFTQHLHDESEDMIVVLEGSGALRQGDTYTPIVAGEGIFVPVGEVHGTVNDSGAPARLISFQRPPIRRCTPASATMVPAHPRCRPPATAARCASSPWPRAVPRSANPATGAAWSPRGRARATSASTISACRSTRTCPTRRLPLKRYS